MDIMKQITDYTALSPLYRNERGAPFTGPAVEESMPVRDDSFKASSARATRKLSFMHSLAFNAGRPLQVGAAAAVVAGLALGSPAPVLAGLGILSGTWLYRCRHSIRQLFTGNRPHMEPAASIPEELPAFSEKKQRENRETSVTIEPGKPLLDRPSIFIQIDGLGAEYLKQALDRGYMPQVNKLLQSGDFQTQTYRCGLPSCTPASQAGILFGDLESIPGFRYYDKARATYVTGFNLKGIKENFCDLLDRKPGLTTGGASYSNIYSAGEQKSALNLEKLSNGSMGSGELKALLALFTRPDAIIDMLGSAMVEMGADFLDHLRSREREKPGRDYLFHPSIPFLRAFAKNVCIRDISTAAIKDDIRHEIPSIYVNFGGFDTVAHLYNPGSKAALKSLRGIDRKIGEIVEESQEKYEIFILSDHGQTPSVPFHKKFGLPFQDFLNTAAGEEVIFASSGNMSHIYLKEPREQLDLKVIEEEHPAFVQILRQHPGIGLVVARDGDEMVVMNSRGTLKIGRDGAETCVGTDPLQGWPDRRDVLERQLRDLLNNRLAGDLILFGAADEDRIVDLEDTYSLGVGLQFGAHGGLGGTQTMPFIIHPIDVPLDTEGILNSSDLYYQLVRNLHTEKSL